jgi:translation initiation factor IF-3
MSASHSSSHYKACLTKPLSTPPFRHVDFMRSASFVSNNEATSTSDPFPDLTRDRAILARYVRITLPEGGSSPPEPLQSALSRVRQGTEHLVQISKVDDDGVAICRIMTVADLLKQKKEKERVQKEHKKSLKQSVPKQLELNWGIGSNDLEHKLTQLKDFIENGKKVEVVLASKKRQRQATPEEGVEVLRKVRAKLAEAGGKEIKEMQGGQVGRHTVLTMRKKGLD